MSLTAVSSTKLVGEQNTNDVRKTLPCSNFKETLEQTYNFSLRRGTIEMVPSVSHSVYLSGRFKPSVSAIIHHVICIFIELWTRLSDPQT